MRARIKDGPVRAWRSGCVLFAISAVAVAQSSAAPASSCQRLILEGQVSTGQQWRSAIGQGWVFRVQPIPASPSGYTGWDLVVDREPPAGYPDALLLATLPYDSINEREIGTTFGLRAQDAIGWNPRTFRFLTDPRQFRDAQQWLLEFERNGSAQRPDGQRESSRSGTADLARLLALQKEASSGEFRILDAHIVPGIADPKPYAQAWALAGSRMQHEVEPVTPGQANAQGKLVWMRFSLTLWLPARWRLPAGLPAVRIGCPA